MSTITSLKFAVESSWDGSGIDQAQAAISSLKADIEAMSEGRIKLQVDLEGVQEAKAKIDEISRDHDTVIRAEADTAEAKAKIEEASRDQMVLFEVKEEGVSEAKAKIDEASRRRDADIDVNEHGASSVMAKIMAIKAMAQNIDIKIDSSGAQAALSKVGSLLSSNILLVTALTAALVAMGAAAAMVGGALLTALGGGVLIAGAAITAMYKHQTEQIQDNIRMQQAQADTADNQVAKAFQNVAQVATKGAQEIEQAQNQVAQSQQNVASTAEQGGRSIQNANQQAAQANQALIRSQQDVAQAYEDAQRSLQDLQMQQEQSGDNIKSAQLAVRRAQIKVDQGPQQGSKTPELDQEEAVNQLALAQDHLNSTVLKSQQTNQDYQKAQAQGIEGSDKVVQAKQRESDAQQKAADAQQNIQDVIRTAAENNSKAQLQLTDSVQRLAQQQQTAAENNAKAQQELQNAQIGAADAHRQLDAAMAKATTTGMQFLSMLNDMVAPLQGPLKDGLDSLMKQLKEMAPALQGVFAAAGPLVQPFVDTLTGAVRGALPGFTSALGGMRDMMPGLQSGMTILGTATGNMMATLGQDAKNLGQIAHDFGKNFGDFINIWADFVKKTGPDAAATFDNMGKGMNSLTKGSLNGIAGFEHNARPDEGKMGGIQSTFQGAGDLAQQALPGAGTLAKGIGSNVSSVVQPLAKPVGDLAGGLMGASGESFEKLAPGLRAMSEAVGQLVTALLPAIPLIAAFTSGFGQGFGIVLQALTPVIKVFADIVAGMLTSLQPLAPIINAIAIAFGVWKAATLALTVAQLAFNLASKANPYVLVVVAIMALVAGIIYLATKTQFFQTVWHGMTVAFQATMNAMKVAWDAFSGAMVTAWNAVWGGIQTAFTAVMNFLGGKWGWLLALFFPIGTFIALAAHWKQVWEGIKIVGEAIWNFISGLWSGFLNGMKALWDNISGAISDSWARVWDWIKRIASDIWNGIKAWWDAEVKIWATVWNVFKDTITGIWSGMWNGISSVASNIWNGIKKGWDGFADGLKKGFEWIRDRAREIWDDMKSVFAKPINFVFNAMSDTVGKVISSLSFPHDPVRLASGGQVPGNGHPRADDVPAMLSSKEFVVNADSAQKNLAALNHINNGGVLAPISPMNNFAPGGPQKFADGGEVKGPNGQPTSDQAVASALGWAQSQNGREYNADGWLDCSGLASGVYDLLKGHSPQREFTTVSDFGAMGFKRGSGGMFEIGVLPEPGDAGHMAMTLDGHPIESAGGGKGIQVDGGAWGADNSYFSDHYYLPGDQFSPQYFGKGWDGESSGDKGFFGKIAGAFSGVVNKARGLVSEAFIKLTNPILSVIPSPFPGTSLPGGGAVKDFVTRGRDDIATFMRGHEKSQGSGGIGGPVGGVIPEGDHLKIIQDALDATHTPPPGDQNEWLQGMNTLITRESGWNAAAVNDYDSNAAAGNASVGLAQVIPTTFEANKAAGHDNIYAPVDNVAASINYIKSRYGNIDSVQQANASMPPKGYEDGTTSADPGWAVVGEAGPELIKFNGGEPVMNNVDMNKMLQNLQGVAQQHSQGFQSALTAPIDAVGTDLGFGSITGASGFIPKLITESIGYAQKLNGWTPPAGSLLGSAMGIKSGNGGELANQDPNALAQQNPGTGVLDNPPSAAQAGANAGVDAQAQALKDGKLPSPTPASSMVGGDLHIHAQDGNPVKEWYERLHLHSAGFDPLG